MEEFAMEKVKGGAQCPQMPKEQSLNTVTSRGSRPKQSLQAGMYMEWLSAGLALAEGLGYNLPARQS
jgi:hypothetical protein